MIGDFIYDNMGWLVFGLFITLATMVFFGIKYEDEEHTRLMTQCMQDGKKEYECTALLKDQSGGRVGSTIVMPMVVGR